MSKPSKAQVEILRKLSDGPIYYGNIPGGTRDVLRWQRWAVTRNIEQRVCYIITDEGRKVLEEADNRG